MLKAANNGYFEKQNFEKEELRKERKRELSKNIIIGATLRSIHKKQGTEAYLLQIIEPFLSRANRKLFGLPF